ncbi:MAG: hypothetical protein ABIG11_05710, partial [bacterium]
MSKSGKTVKKTSSYSTTLPLSEWRTPFSSAIPMFLWSIAVIVLYYTSKYFRDIFPFIIQAVPDFSLLKFPMLLQYAKHMGILS